VERWPSGLRRTPGKCVYVNPYRGFESLFLRQENQRVMMVCVGSSRREIVNPARFGRKQRQQRIRVPRFSRHSHRPSLFIFSLISYFFSQTPTFSKQIIISLFDFMITIGFSGLKNILRKLMRCTNRCSNITMTNLNIFFWINALKF
jgi:hypothetical protein